MATEDVIILSSDEELDSVEQPESSLSKLMLNTLPECSPGIHYAKNTPCSDVIITPSSPEIKSSTQNDNKKIGIFKENDEISVALVSGDESSESLEIVDPEECVEVFAKGISNNVSLNSQTCKNEVNLLLSNQQHADKNIKNNNLVDKNEVKTIENNNVTLNTTIQTHFSKERDLIDDCQLKKKFVEDSKIEYTTVNKSNEVVSDEIVEVQVNGINSPDEAFQYPDFFLKFLEYCGSLEDIEEDRVKLIKKIKKRFRETDTNFIRSQDFKKTIVTYLSKISKSNLYIIVKEITDELSSRRKIIIEPNNSNIDDKHIKSDSQNPSNDCALSGKLRKKTKIVNQIVKNLDKLGEKIRELEEVEVDLSDEEDSSYVKLQKYREKFIQIYKKLCEYTGQVSDAKRFYSRKICFSGSKYPEINKCIEAFLNKTKKFPDFVDIMKLLESQSSSLGLPSNKDTLRILATEIFQQVGVVLQQRRKYDLWDSFSSYLNDEKDPASSNPELDKILHKNFETRIKKEQEIFKYYADLQEKERLEPEEIAEEEANESPESGNEDENEIEEIEKNLIEKIYFESGKSNSDAYRNEKNGEVLRLSTSSDSSRADSPSSIKETKNNYKNCKSLRWRTGDKVKPKENANMNESFLEQKENLTGATNIFHWEDSEDKIEIIEDMEIEKQNKSGRSTLEKEQEDDSDLECVCVGSRLNKEKIFELEKSEVIKEPINYIEDIQRNENKSPTRSEFSKNTNRVQRVLKRDRKYENNFGDRKKKCLTSLNKVSVETTQVVDIDNESENWKERKNEVFDISYCHIEHNFGTIFNNLSLHEDWNYKKKGERKKVFRDLTNINRFMTSNKRKTSLTGLFSRFYHGFHKIEKPWKKKFKSNPRINGSKIQNCALNNEEKKGDNLGREGRHSGQKEIQRNPESGGEEGSNFFCGSGSGNEDDNSDNHENKRNGNLEKDDVDEKRCEEEEEEEDRDENEEEINGESKLRIESNEHSNIIPSTTGNTPIDDHGNYELFSNKNASNMASLHEDRLKLRNSVDNELNKRQTCESINNIIRLNCVDIAVVGDSRTDSIDISNFNKKNLNHKIGNTEDPKHSIREECDSCKNSKDKTFEGRNTSETVNKFIRINTEIDGKKSNSLQIESICNKDNKKKDELREIVIDKNFDEIKSNQDKKISCLLEEWKTGEDSGEKKFQNEIILTEDESREVLNGNHARNVMVTETENELEGNCERVNMKNDTIVNNLNFIENEEMEKEISEIRYMENVQQLNGESNELSKKIREEVREKQIKLGKNNDRRKRIKFSTQKDVPEKGNVLGKCVPVESEKGYMNEKKIVKEVTLEGQESRKQGRRRYRASSFRKEIYESVDKDCMIIRNEPKQYIVEDNSNFTRLKQVQNQEIDGGARSLIDNSPTITYSKLSCIQKNDSSSREFKTHESLYNQKSEVGKSETKEDSYIDYLVSKIRKKSTSSVFSASDEERVKKFLLHSPSSISITPPKKLTGSKPPSEAALQALATLRGLKGISTTRIIGKPKDNKVEDDVVLIGESPRRKIINSEVTELKRSQLPVISNVQSISSTYPKIVNIKGNALEFGTVSNTWYNKNTDNEAETESSSSIRISNVWGNLPSNFIQTIQSNGNMPSGCNFLQTNSSSCNVPRKKNAKKNVEYVVLD